MAYTAESVDRGYNNRAAVPDHARWFARWAQTSAAARDRYRPVLDLRYGPNPKETLDLFVPASPARGTFLFLHGGYWRALDKSDHLFVAPAFVDAGHAVAVANYDLCPAVSIATIVDECRRALAWLVREGGRHGANPTNIVVGGHSAGGHLAAMLLASAPASLGLERHPVAAAISISGVHDLRPLTLFSFNADFMLDEREAARLSPALLAPQCNAPIGIAVGADETSEFVRQAQVLWDAWPEQRPRGAQGPLLVPDRHHFSVIDDYTDRSTALSHVTLDLLERRAPG